MPFSLTKIPLPYVMFCSGIAPYLLTVFFDYFDLLNLHGSPFAFLLLIIDIFVSPICFIIGFFQSFKFTGKHRIAGLTLNGLGLAVLLFWVFGRFN